jgi:hypothetical protein
MKTKILFVILCIGFSCGKDENKSGYNCVNNECIATFDNPRYLTLQDCQTACGTSGTNIPPPSTKPGSIYFNVTFSTICQVLPIGITTNVVDLGYGYSSTDVTNDAYIQSWKIKESQKTFIASDVKPGIYYYKAKKSSTDSKCATVIKTGTVTVNSGKITSVTISF